MDLIGYLQTKPMFSLENITIVYRRQVSFKSFTVAVAISQHFEGFE